MGGGFRTDEEIAANGPYFQPRFVLLLTFIKYAQSDDPFPPAFINPPEDVGGVQ